MSQTTYAALFAYLGTTWNSLAPIACIAGQFAIPDLRGATVFANDAQGVNGAAGVNDCGPPGNGCGHEYRAITQANLPAVNFVIAAGQGTHTHAVSGGVVAGTTSTSVTLTGGATTQPLTASNITIVANNLPQMLAASGGSNTVLSIQNPAAIGTKAIKY